MAVPGETVYMSGGELRTATSTRGPADGDPFTAYTDSGGEASVYYEFASDATGTVDVDVEVADTTASITFQPEVADTTRRPTLAILSGNNQRTDENGDIDDDLVVVVRKDGHLFPGESVTFKAKNGYLGNGVRSQAETTDANGEAKVTYYQEPGSGSDTVTARISNDAGATLTYEIERTFNINGTGSGGGRNDPPPPPAATNRITISPLNTTGEPGEEVTVNVASSPSGVFATLGSNDFEATRFSPQSGVTPFTSTLLLPVEEGTHSFFATGGVLTAGSASVTVEAELGTLSITAIGTASAGAQTFSITALDADGDRAIGVFTATLRGTGFTSRNVEISGGSGNARVTLPTAAGLYTLTVSATGYEDGSTTFRVTGSGQQEVADEDEEEVEEEVTVAAEPDSIEITGPSTRSGTVNEELDAVLIVRVRDDDDDGVEGARVIFRVVSGRGRLSARGNGRAIGVVTD